MREQYRYSRYVHQIDIDAFEDAIGFEPTRQGTNKHGEAEDIGHCPDPWSLHKNGDTTGKFAINRDKRVYNCFVCGGGTLLDLASAVKGLTDQKAEEWLYDLALEEEVSNQGFLSEIDALFHEAQREKPVLPYYNEHVLVKWTEDINRLDSWLTSRGISDVVAREARLGYQVDAMRMAPIKQGKPREQPYAGPCVYFPHFWNGRLVGWQQRWLDDDRPKWIPKYTNTSGFPRIETLYNYEDWYLADRPIVVVESVPTALCLRSLGYPAIATFGSSVSDEQMRLLRQCHQGIVVAPDNDAPGRKWLGYTEEELRYGKTDRIVLAEHLAHFIPVRVIEPVGDYNSGADLGDLVDEGWGFAREAIGLLYREAEYYYPSHSEH